MQVAITDRYDAGDWLALVERLGGNPLHLPAVATSEHPGAGLRFLVVRDGAAPVACGVGVLRVRRRWKVLPQGGLFLSPTSLAHRAVLPEERAAIYRAVLDALGEAGVSTVRFGHAWGEDFSEDEALAPFIDARFVDFTVALDGDDEAILARMRRNHRRNVRQAIKKGVETAEEGGIDAFLLLRELQREAAARQREKDNPFTVGSEDYFRALYDAVYGTECGRTRIARLEGDPVGAVSYLGLGPRAIETRSACNERGYAVNAAYLLKYATCLDLAHRGVEVLNLSAVPAEAREEGHAEHGLYAFKEGFGGRENVRTSVTIDTLRYRRMRA